MIVKEVSLSCFLIILCFDWATLLAVSAKTCEATHNVLLSDDDADDNIFQGRW